MKDNGKTLTAKANSKPETLFKLACQRWWERTDGGSKHNSYLKIPIHLDDGSVVVASFSKSTSGGFQCSLMREFFVQDVATPANPYA